ncbi:HAD superfamily hydrolase (TIGR01509 family) [Roseicyclus mahoneyensis]|uniref:HAD superfamily hydrolase (TIGR01509 family) n=1 Tax=Roseicyclus mahoneyensis TaxID=164332 RepID=A0A316GGF5_9RHOB|nr:HAD superfamily hydrolase (TIGR01509 family) [Roseicyclus mahoneyensis]
MPTVVIFDFDGVLVDSEVISLSTLRDSLQEFGVAMTEAQVRETFLGGSIRQINAFLQTVANPAYPPDHFEQRWYAHLFARFRAELRPMSGALALLDHLDTRGHGYCIASGGSMERLGVALAVTGLAPRFGDRVYSADMVARGKPAPDIFLHAAREMGIAPERCLVIEDSPAGASAAHAAGMRALGFVGGAHLRGRTDEHRDLLMSLHVETVIDDLGAVRDLL